MPGREDGLASIMWVLSLIPAGKATVSVGDRPLVFLDADKPSNADYFAWALKLSRKGTLIVVDNVIRDGMVVDARSKDPNITGVRKLNEAIAREKRVVATTIQTVGGKGYDGFTVALVVD
jgi:predicted O-methyltransferase YrrM